MNKYRNRKVTAGGIKFDSKREANRYSVLYAMQELGKISNLRLQVPYELIPSQKLPEPYMKKGRMVRTIRGVIYIADFVYTRDGREVVEDAKGVKTPEYVIKKKLMLEKYGIQIKEV